MAERTKILFAIPELDSGGPDRVFFEVIRGLDRSAFAPQLVVSNGGGRYLAALPEDVEVCVTGGGRYPVWRFARAVDRLRPDLIVTTLRMNVTGVAARPFQRHRPPLIARQANAIAADFVQLRRKSLIKHRLAERVILHLLRYPRALVAQSPDMMTELARHTVPGQEIAVIGNPVSPADMDAACAAQRTRGELQVRGRPSLVAVGRLAPQKGFDLLLPAFARFLRDFPEAVLTIFGEGPERAAYEAQARALDIHRSVLLAGHSDRVLAEVASADIFVSSSRYEGFSNAILEAMALGSAVVATNSEGATRDLVRDGETGILVEVLAADALAQGLMRMMRADRAALGAAARRYAIARFGRDRIVADYAALFRRVLASSCGSHAAHLPSVAAR